MARRSWRVAPDHLHETLDGRQIPCVSRQKLITEVADAITMADRAGGTITVLFGRSPTGLPGEMVTDQALVTWQDRADARTQYEEPVSFEDGEPVELFEAAEPEAEPEAA